MNKVALIIAQREVAKISWPGPAESERKNVGDWLISKPLSMQICTQTSFDAFNKSLRIAIESLKNQHGEDVMQCTVKRMLKGRNFNA